eukprot:scaffold7769_cov53-Attheya_sp.AAC.7
MRSAAQQGNIQGIYIDKAGEVFNLFGILRKEDRNKTMFTLTKPRLASEMQAQAVQVKKSERESNRDKQKLATRGLEPAFAMTTYSPIKDGD